jgi:hypothetical protein
VTVTCILLQSKNDCDSIEHIGLYVTKGDRWGYPIINSVSDILHKTAFENSPDICTTITLEPSVYPYVITPCTYYAGVVAGYELDVVVSACDAEEVAIMEWSDAVCFDAVGEDGERRGSGMLLLSGSTDGIRGSSLKNEIHVEEYEGKDEGESEDRSEKKNEGEEEKEKEQTEQLHERWDDDNNKSERQQSVFVWFFPLNLIVFIYLFFFFIIIFFIFFIFIFYF